MFLKTKDAENNIAISKNVHFTKGLCVFKIELFFTLIFLCHFINIYIMRVFENKKHCVNLLEYWKMCEREKLPDIC